jgi:hypothetical protein
MRMTRHIKYSAAERELASAARSTAMNRDVLYHGTRYAQLILETGVLLRAKSDTGELKVSLTRSPEVAVHWASIQDPDDEGRGAVLVLDRSSLERVHKVNAVPGPYWHSKRVFHDEAEEQISDDVTDLPVISSASLSKRHRLNGLERSVGGRQRSLQ